MAPHTYGYDAAGLWVQLTTPDHICWRYWGGGRVVNELRVSGDAADDIQVTWVGAAGSPVAEQVVGPGERLTLLAAAAGGSVLLEADTDVRPVAYAPHGHRDDTSALAAPAFNGEHLDAGSGCYLLGAGHHRPYSPTLGMFLAPDSASPFSAGGLNPLAYCAGDPINRSDPSGHFWKWIVAGVGLALGAVAVAATFGAASAAVGAVALGGFAALTKSGAAAIAATTLGVLSVGVEVAAIKAEATGDTGTAGILGWVGLGLGIAGAAPAIAKAAMKGATRVARFAQRALGARSSAIPMRGAAGSGRAAQAAAAQAAPSPAASSPATAWYANKATYAGKKTFAAYPVGGPPALSGAAARQAARAHMLNRQAPRVRWSSGSSSGSDFGGIADELAAAEPVSAFDWTPPPLKQYPSPAFTTGHLQPGAAGATRQIDVAGHISYMESLAPARQLTLRERAIRRIIARIPAWRDPPPKYDQATLPSYEELFGG